MSIYSNKLAHIEVVINCQFLAHSRSAFFLCSKPNIRLFFKWSVHVHSCSCSDHSNNKPFKIQTFSVFECTRNLNVSYLDSHCYLSIEPHFNLKIAIYWNYVTILICNLQVCFILLNDPFSLIKLWNLWRQKRLQKFWKRFFKKLPGCGTSTLSLLKTRSSQTLQQRTSKLDRFIYNFFLF